MKIAISADIPLSPSTWCPSVQEGSWPHSIKVEATRGSNIYSCCTCETLEMARRERSAHTAHCSNPRPPWKRGPISSLPVHLLSKALTKVRIGNTSETFCAGLTNDCAEGLLLLLLEKEFQELDFCFTCLSIQLLGKTGTF